MGMLPIILMFVILYFLMIRPQMKKAKEHKTMLEALQKGDEVIAVGIPRQGHQGQRQLRDASRSPPTSRSRWRSSAISRLLPKGTIKDAQ